MYLSAKTHISLPTHPDFTWGWGIVLDELDLREGVLEIRINATQFLRSGRCRAVCLGRRRGWIGAAILMHDHVADGVDEFLREYVI